MSAQNFVGKAVVVTGASSGLGASIAEDLSAHGARLVLVGRDKPRLERVAATCAGNDHAVVVADVTTDAGVEEIAQHARFLNLPLGGLVHSAGVFRPTKISGTTRDDFSLMWRTNVEGPYFLTQRLLDDLCVGSSVVFISSVSGHTGIAEQSGYAAGKGAIEAVMRSLSIELGERGIRVNAVAPGFIATEINEELRTDPRRVGLLTEAIVAGRLGTPSDVAAAVRYLLSADSTFVTGQSLHVDGNYPISAVQKGVLR